MFGTIFLRESMFKQNDIVRLLRIDRVKYLSGPKCRPASPKGEWVIVGGLEREQDLVLAKDATIIRIPISDVTKIADYDLDVVIEAVRNAKPVFKKTGPLRK